MRALIEVLNDLSWIHECLAMDHTGEAKSSMSDLAKRLRQRPDDSLGDCEVLASTVSDAREAFGRCDESEMRQAVVDLMSMSRALWTALLAVVEGAESKPGSDGVTLIPNRPAPEGWTQADYDRVLTEHQRERMRR